MEKETTLANFFKFWVFFFKLSTTSRIESKYSGDSVENRGFLSEPGLTKNLHEKGKEVSALLLPHEINLQAHQACKTPREGILICSNSSVLTR